MAYLAHVSPRLILHHSVGPLLVQDAVATLPAPDDVSLLQLILMATVATCVGYALIWDKLLLLLGWQHCLPMFDS